jgi:hypothetical protein
MTHTPHIAEAIAAWIALGLGFGLGAFWQGPHWPARSLTAARGGRTIVAAIVSWCHGGRWDDAPTPKQPEGTFFISRDRVRR